MAGDPRRLLRRAGDPAAYPTEPSDEEVAAAAGVPVAEVIRFDLNTLGGGPLPAVAAASAAFDPARAVEYGDQQYRVLRARLADRLGVDAARITVGAGADELIRLVTRLVAGDEDAVVIPTPTFGMFAVEAGLAGATTVEVARHDPGSRQTVDDLRGAARRSGARLVWICSPNNPTGDAYPLDEIEAIATGTDAIVVVDEAYLEFAAASLGVEVSALSAVGLQPRIPNLLVLRSMAKAYGLAGARIGYLVVPGWLAERANAERLPLPVGSHTEALAIAALGDEAGAGARRESIVAERARIGEALEELGWRVLPSVTNFLLARPPAGLASVVSGGLLRRGLVVREYPGASPLAAWLRITARAPQENDRLLSAVRALAVNNGLAGA
jgi:histidinol-phosphate aminotransferase